MAALSELLTAPHSQAMQSCLVWGLGNGVAGGGAGSPARPAWPGCRMSRLFQALPSADSSHRLAQLPMQTWGPFSSGLWLLQLGSGHSTQGSLYLVCEELTLCIPSWPRAWGTNRRTVKAVTQFPPEFHKVSGPPRAKIGLCASKSISCPTSSPDRWGN